MAIRCPSKFGIIFRKSERTATSISRLSAWWGRHGPLNEDEHLIGYSVAMSYPDLLSEVREIEDEGCVRGQDFVCTVSSQGVTDSPVPSWLAMELAPSGNPPELEAKMEPEVRAMWEAQRMRMYSLAQ